VSLPTLHEWQRECLEKMRPRVLRPTCPGIVQAVTGSGKSRVQGELTKLLISTLPQDHVNLVVTSRQALVEQLYKDVSPITGPSFLGTFYGNGKRFLGKRAIFTTYRSLQKCVDVVAANGGKLGGIILDEAHNSGAEALNDWLCDRVESGFRRLFGFTATDFRGNVKERLEWCPERIYAYPWQRAIADGVIVNYIHKPRSGHVTATDDEVLAMIAETDALSYGAGLVTAADIEDAKHFADVLTQAGLIARHVASDQGRGILPDVEAKFAGGELIAITSPRLVSEGYDYPPLKWMCFRAPLSRENGRVLAIQTVGRVLRKVWPGVRTKDRPLGFDRELARWGPMTEALVLDPRNSFAQIGLDHDPALGFKEEEEAPPLKVRTGESEGAGVIERPPDYLADTHVSVAWAYALLSWAQQGPTISPLALCMTEARARPDRTPSAVTKVQGRFAFDALRVLQRIAKLNEPHRTHLFDGLELVMRWSEGDEGVGRWRAAAAILRAADTLIAWFGTPLFNHGRTLNIPERVTPYSSSPALDMGSGEVA
jgi:hypothetical protein